MSITFDPQAYGPAIAALLIPERVPDLGPGSPNRAAKAALEAIEAPAACRAGLWLLHDFLDESHSISQDIDSKDGSFWHAIMHRREPDHDNSKYWWKRVGSHPILDRLRDASKAIGYTFISPYDFVDYCEAMRDTSGTGEDLARRVQLLEWQLLFDWCWKQKP